MTGRAKRLPVVSIPEQLLIPAMRNDVINLAGRCDQTEFPTMLAEWMAAKKLFAFSPPPPGIVKLSSCCNLRRALCALPSPRIRLPLVCHMLRTPRLPFLCEFIAVRK